MAHNPITIIEVKKEQPTSRAQIVVAGISAQILYAFAAVGLMKLATWLDIPFLVVFAAGFALMGLLSPYILMESTDGT